MGVPPLEKTLLPVEESQRRPDVFHSLYKDFNEMNFNTFHIQITYSNSTPESV